MTGVDKRLFNHVPSVDAVLAVADLVVAWRSNRGDDDEDNKEAT